jgi:PTS system mannose-specific IID component
MTDYSEYTKIEGIGIGSLASIFFRSLSIHSSWNFSRMQNVGFAFSLIPLVKKVGKTREQTAEILTRHIELFNTHPYLTAPIIGSVVKLEERYPGREGADAINLKKAIMAPYAAMGDPFFWGALKPAAAIIGFIMALKGWLLAPLVFLVMYNTVHLWVRLRGFIAGYTDGRGGIDFLRGLNLPGMSRRIRWFSVVLLGLLVGMTLTIPVVPDVGDLEVLPKLIILIIIVPSYWMIKRGISPLVIVYGMSILIMSIMV